MNNRSFSRHFLQYLTILMIAQLVKMSYFAIKFTDLFVTLVSIKETDRYS